MRCRGWNPVAMCKACALLLSECSLPSLGSPEESILNHTCGPAVCPWIPQDFVLGLTGTILLAGPCTVSPSHVLWGATGPHSWDFTGTWEGRTGLKLAKAVSRVVEDLPCGLQATSRRDSQGSSGLWGSKCMAHPTPHT